MNRSALLTMTWLAGTAALLHSCGMGTEIGNGLKTDDGGSGDKNAKKSAEVGNASPTVAPMDPANDKPVPAADTAKANTGASTGEGSAEPPLDAVTTKGFDPRLIYTSCATPLALAPHASYAFAETVKDSGLIVRVQADWIEAVDQAAAHWLIKDADGKALAQVEPLAPPSGAAAAVFGPEHEPLVDAYACGPLTAPTAESVAAGGTLAYSVGLTAKGGTATTLSWTMIGGKLDHVAAGSTTLRPKE